jgi:hypothetical protein
MNDRQASRRIASAPENLVRVSDAIFLGVALEL